MPIELSLENSLPKRAHGLDLHKLKELQAMQEAQTAACRADDPFHWNRCTIKGGAKYDKEVVLDAIIKRVSHFGFLLPYLYQIEGEDSFFLFRHGKVIVKKIVESKWVIHDPTRTIEEPIQVSFVLEYLTTEEEPYDPLKNVEQVVLKRTNAKEGVVDLRNFQYDPDFKNIYVSFHCNFLIEFIVAYVKRMFPHFEMKGLILSHNGLEHLEMVSYMRKYYNKIHTLDLRHNKLTFSGFDKLPNLFTIKHLLIDGNPMCEDYESAGEMICEIGGKLPSLEYLDNVEVSYVQQFPQRKASLKSFLRNPAYSDLVDHFLHHYFLLFENDREKLIHTYHINASLSVSVFRNELLQSATVPEFFASSNRNLLSMSDVTKTYDNIFIGKVRVFEALKSMPKMAFDFHTFNVDVPVTAKGELVVVSCTGCFCLPEEGTVRKYSLSRICIMCPLRNGLGEWLILNDMWTIMNVSPKAYLDFTRTRDRSVKNNFTVMLNPFLKDKAILISVVSNLTHMKAAWVEKFLSESGWDLEMTLLAFTDQFKANQIPADAFSTRALTNE